MLKDESAYPRLPISQLRKMIAHSLDTSFAAHGLHVTNEQELILRALRHHSQISQTELAAFVGQDRNNLSRTLAILEKKGLVQKENSLQDRRYCKVSITEQGQQVHEKLWEILEEWRTRLFAGISPNELHAFAATANKLIDNIGNMALAGK